MKKQIYIKGERQLLKLTLQDSALAVQYTWELRLGCFWKKKKSCYDGKNINHRIIVNLYA